MPPLNSVSLRNGLTATIRPARSADAETLLSNVNEVGAEEVYLHTEKLEKTPEQEREWIAGYDGKRSLLLVAEIQGKVVGQADVRCGQLMKNSHTAQFGISLLKEARGIGLGRVLTEACIAWARSTGVRKLCLTVFATNHPAMALYRRLGFEEEARLKRQVILRGVPVDEVVMALWL